jgi:hypothetical protein
MSPRYRNPDVAWIPELDINAVGLMPPRQAPAFRAVRLAQGGMVGIFCDLCGGERPAEDQFGQGVGDLAVGLQVCTYCFMVKATSAWPMRLLSAFQSIFAAA